MNSTPLWQVITAHRAQKLLARAARPDRERLLRAITEMATDPFTGDVLPLKGQQDSFRRRIGDWRIFFDVDRQLKRVDVTDIQRRTTTTYKKRS